MFAYLLQSEAAAYEFTTLTCIPGNLVVNGTKIQMLDLPGIIEGAAQGKGRGREVISVAHSADLILMVLDGAREENNQHRDILTNELETMVYLDPFYYHYLLYTLIVTHLYTAGYTAE